ncbi:hypothetical protein AB0F36_26685 [Streptomyces sp. NPDC029080]|uniref:hypothetical protein n=1 Tax=Streptomyces sp. NPDC029080 TaxID=3155017 RepID=UPI00340C2A18
MTIVDSATKPTASAGERTPLTRWLAVVAMAVGTFALVTVESLPVGLLPFIGSAMDVSEGTAGLMVTVPGLVAAATAPLFPVAIRHLDRRVALIGLITLMVLADGLTALAATALNTSVYNLAIALGALLGGIVATHLSVNAALTTGALFTLLTSLAVWSARRS